MVVTLTFVLWRGIVILIGLFCFVSKIYPRFVSKTYMDRPITQSFEIPESLTASANSGFRLADEYTASFSCYPFTLPEKCVVHLDTASIPYSIPNVAGVGVLPRISSGNNRITINYNGTGNVDRRIDQGLYSFEDVQYALNAIAVDQAWILPGAVLFVLVGIQSSQKIQIVIDPTVFIGGAVPAGGFSFTFVNPGVDGLNDSMGTLLGFGTGATVYSMPGGSTVVQSWTGDDPADFATITSYQLYCDLVSGSYINGRTGQILYSFPLGGTAPNSVMAWQSTLKFPVPATSGKISQVNIWFTDNSGFKIPLTLFQGNISLNMVISDPAKYS